MEQAAGERKYRARSEASFSLALFFSFGAFFITNPFVLWDIGMFQLVSANADFTHRVIGAMLPFALLLAIGCALYFFSRRVAYLPRGLIVLGTALYGVGCVGFALAQANLIPALAPTAVALGLCLGFGVVVAIIAWCLVLSRYGLRSALIWVSAACGVFSAIGLLFALGLFSDVCIAYAVFVALGVSMPMYYAVKKGGLAALAPEADDVEHDHPWDSMRSMVLNPCLGLFLFVLVMSSRGFVFMSYTHIGAWAVMIGALAMMALVMKWPHFSLHSIYHLILPVAAAVFIVLSSFPVESTSFGIGFLISHVIMAAIALLAMASLCAIARAGEFSPPFIGSAFVVVVALAGMIGVNLRELVVDEDALGAILLVCSISYFVYVLVTPIIDYHRLMKTPEGSGEVSNSHLSAISQICATLASDCALSTREQEVLLYLVRGHRPAYIAELLCISEHTVRTHVRNMYRKLSVGSREELVQLVEKTSSESGR